MAVVAAALVTAGSFLNATALAGGAAIGLSSGVTFAAVHAFQQIAIGLALSAAARALTPKQSAGGSAGTKLSITFGEAQPQSMILGVYGTAGDLVYHGAFGKAGDTPNAYYVQVIELADWPARMRRIWINGEWATLGSTAHPDGLGFPVAGYQHKGRDFLWVKFRNGTETTADPYLIDAFGDDPDRPWTPTMIGRGIPHVIVTSLFKAEMHPGGRPEVLVELEAWGHYDRRRDSTAGGTGPQRWANWATWEPTDNPIVLADNILRGIHDPITGEHVWGGRGITSLDIPPSVMFAAANECDQAIALAIGGVQPQYRAGLEVRVDEEPAAIIEELLKACQGQIAEAAGQWMYHAGPPELPIYAFRDDDIVVTEAEQFDPFPGLDEAYNGAAASYPEPAQGWSAKDAPLRENATYLAEDGGKTNIVQLQFTAVPYGRQVQRLTTSAMKDSRRFRRHTLVLPPEARAIGPLDTVSWSSDRYGYETKLWSVDMVEDLPNGCVAVALREVDPTDYDWGTGDELDSPVGFQPRPAVPFQTADFSVEPATIKDAVGNNRRPAIRLNWTVKDDVTGIGYRLRLAADHSQVPINSVGTQADAAPGGDFVLTIGANRLTIAGQTLGFTIISDPTDGTELIGPLLPLTEYELQAIYLPLAGRAWSAWLPVTTPNILIDELDLGEIIRGKVEAAKDAADAAAEDAAAALLSANNTADLVSGLSAETIADLNALVDALGGLDLATIEDLTGIAAAGLKDGWSDDPTFRKWTGSSPDKWTGVGIATFGSHVTTGFKVDALLIDVPTGAAVVSVVASSAVAGQLPAHDLGAEYVVLEATLNCISGSLAGASFFAEWLVGGTWTKGHAFGANNSPGTLATWGFVVDSGRLQFKSVIWRRPAAATAVRITFVAKSASPTGAVSIRVDYLNIRTATEAEVKAHVANAYTDAEITELENTITGPTGAIAFAKDEIRTEFEGADAVVSDSVLAVSNDLSALAGRVTTVESTFSGANLCRNPVFADGVRAAGVTPATWGSWDSVASVVARTGTAPQSTAPAGFMGRIPGDGVNRELRAHGPYPVKAGDRVALKIQAAAVGTGTINTQVGLNCRWYDPTGLEISAVPNFVTLTGTAWVTGAWQAVAPAGAATLDVAVRRPAGGSAHVVLFTGVESIIVDAISHALATTAGGTATTASNAVSTINNTVTTEFGSFAAMVEQIQTAYSTAGKAASAFVIRSVAGGGSAGFRMVAWDDETGVGGAFVFDADNVIAPGTLSAGSIVVTDLGYNMVPDDQLQSGNAWTRNDLSWSIIKDTSHTTAKSLGEARWTAADSTAVPARYFSEHFPVRAGQRLVCSYEMQKIGTGNFNAYAAMQYLDKSGGSVGLIALDPPGVTASTALLARSVQTTVPAGTFKARWVWTVEPATTAGTIAGLRFFSPSVISNEDASVLITPDGAFINELTAVTAWIKTANIIDANIVRLKLAEGSVSSGGASIRSTNLTITPDNTFLTVVSLTISKEASKLVNLWMDFNALQLSQHLFTAGVGSNTLNGVVTWRLLKDGVAQWTRGGSPKTYHADIGSDAGSTLYQLQVRTTPPATPVGMDYVGKTQNMIIDDATMAIQQVAR